MTTSTIIIIILAWCLANLLISLLFITSTGEVIGLETLPSVLASMIFNIIPVFITIQLFKNRKHRKHTIAKKGR